MENNLKRTLLVLLLVLAAVLNIFVFSGLFAKLEGQIGSAQNLDEKAETVLKLTASSTLLSAGLTAIPSDIATPIAEKLADFSEYFIFILCVIYSEKYLLGILGSLSFRILLPISCGIRGYSLFRDSEAAVRISQKLAIFALALVVAVPLCLKVSDRIYETYNASIEETITASEELSGTTSQLSEADGDQGLISSILEKLMRLRSFPICTSMTGSELAGKASQIVNRYVESLAVMIVTSCVIPILVLVFFVWLVRTLTGIAIPLPTPRRPGRKGL